MKIGATMAFSHLTDPAYIVEAAQLVESAGFHSVWLPEHVLLFAEYASHYPYSQDGKIPGNPEGVLDPFAGLTFIAAQTSTIRLGTGICLVPQRQPVYTAKAVADLDYLSGGRVDFGVGIGWLKEEFDNLQMDFKTRAGRCAEYIEVMKALWAPGLSSYAGKTYQLDDCHFYPKPVQSPHPPIFFGGESDAALERVVSQGDGWYGFDLDPGQLEQRLQRLAQLAEEKSRDVSEFEVFVGPSTKPINSESVSQYRDLGVEQLIVPLMAGNIDRLARRVDKMLELTSTAG
ncbi:MAG: LLM class F420-dependent oxidoreductase [Gammaproteobacteria bacterium]|nr:LLM class F420-dependent oxidoreductase [Gammaproteobacteria bacterium]